jgi:hypothetical protein
VQGKNVNTPWPLVVATPLSSGKCQNCDLPPEKLPAYNTSKPLGDKAYQARTVLGSTLLE